MQINPETGFYGGDAAGYPEEFFTMLPPDAVHAAYFPRRSAHNAIWDFGPGPGGRWYAALCGELSNPLSAELYEYHPGEDRLSEAFRLASHVCIPEREIPPSKIHTSLHPTRDGKLVMTTHTTARSPRHPYWLFDSYYYHPYEGYPGSMVLCFDPESGRVENLGIPVKRDSIYGACYDWRNHALWFVTYLRGRLFRFDLTSLELHDFGQVTEFGSFLLPRDRLGNLYVSSRSGHLLHIEVDSRRVTSLGFPCDEPEENPLWRAHRMIGSGTNGPDGRLYLNILFSDFLLAIEPETLRLEKIRLPRSERWRNTPPASHCGLAFDSAGVLWRLECRASWDRPGGAIHLVRHDLLRGGAPEIQGLVGTPERAAITVSGVHCSSGDQLLVADTNHYVDMPRLLRIDLPNLNRKRNVAPEARDISPYCLASGGEKRFPGGSAEWREQLARAQGFIDRCGECYRFLSEEADTGVRLPLIRVLRLWREVPWGTLRGVRSLRWTASGCLRIEGEAAEELFWQWSPEGGLSREIAEEPVDSGIPEAVVPERLPELARSGRRFAAQVTAWAHRHDGRLMVGTADGVLGIYEPAGGDCFRLGPVGVTGAIRQLVADSEERRFFGVAGDEEDLGMLFSYDEKQGVRELGRLNCSPPGEVVSCNTEPVCLALDGKTGVLAVGCRGNLATVYLFRV